MSIRYEASEVIGASAERVFDALLDLDAALLWMPGAVRMERMSSGPLHEGSEWRETRKVFGREATEQFQLIGLDRPRRLALRVDGTKGTTGRGEYLFTYRLEPVSGGTEVHLDGEIRGLTGVARRFGKLFVGPYRKACAKDLKALKQYLESEAREPTPAHAQGTARA